MTESLRAHRVCLFSRVQECGHYDVCCVVTRYFGHFAWDRRSCPGIFSYSVSGLGKGGISIVRKCLRALIACPYSIYDSILREIELIGASVEDTKYGEDIEMTVLIPEDSGETFNNRLRN